MSTPAQWYRIFNLLAAGKQVVLVVPKATLPEEVAIAVQPLFDWLCQSDVKHRTHTELCMANGAWLCARKPIPLTAAQAALIPMDKAEWLVLEG